MELKQQLPLALRSNNSWSNHYRCRKLSPRIRARMAQEKKTINYMFAAKLPKHRLIASGVTLFTQQKLLKHYECWKRQVSPTSEY